MFDVGTFKFIKTVKLMEMSIAYGTDKASETKERKNKKREKCRQTWDKTVTNILEREVITGVHPCRRKV